MRWWAGWGVALAVLLALAADAYGRARYAHPAVSTAAIVKVTAGGRVEVTVIHDALAFALDDTSANVTDTQMFELLDAPDLVLADAFAYGRKRFAASFQIFADGAPLPFEIIGAPDLGAVNQWKAEHSGRALPCKLHFVVTAQLPAGARGMSVRFPQILADVVLSVDRPGVEPVYFPLAPGENAPGIDVGMVGAGSGTEKSAARMDRPAVSGLGVAWRYLKLGFFHIIPEGTDHALFVLGLFLLTPRVKPLLWQITAFTIAHSTTLTLATLDLVRIPSGVVEPTIALTIAFIGIENLFATRVRYWRSAVAFLFGLVHGLGFASGLMEVGLPTGQLASALIAFNVGVECGHVTILCSAFLLLGWWREKPWFRKRVAIPLSLIIAAVALFWMVQRIMA
jgi:hypothetical protein